MSVISTLVVKLTADTGSFRSAMGKAAGDTGKLQRAYKGAQVASAAGLAAITLEAKKSISTYKDYGSSVNKLTGLMNVSTEDASRLVGQWKRYGIESATGVTAVKILSKNIDAARGGNAAAAESFARLGISMDDLKNMDAAQIMMKARDSMSQMEDKTARTSTMLKLFGKSGTEMLGWVKQSPDDIGKLNDSLGKLGLVWGDKQLTTYKDLAKAQGEMKLAYMGFQMSLAQSLIPTLTALVGVFGSVMTTLAPFGKYLKYAAGAMAGFLIVGKITTMLAAYKTALVQLGAAQKIAALWTKLVTAAQWLWNAAMSANPLGLIVIAIAAAVVALVVMYKKVGWFRAFVDGALKVVGKVFRSVFNAIAGAVRWVVGQVKKHWQLLVVVIGGPLAAVAVLVYRHWDQIRSFVTGAVRKVVDVVRAGWDKLKAATTAVWNAIKAVVSTVAAAIKTVVTTYWNAYKTVILTVGNAIVGAVRKVWSAVTGAISAALAAAKNVVTAGAAKVRAALSAAWSGITGIVSRLWSGIKTAIIRQLQFADAMRTAGAKLVRGLWAGIQSLSGWIWEKVKGFAGTIFNKVKEGLGKLWPFSPSKAGVELGYYLALGIEKGIKLGMPAVDRAVAGLAAAMYLQPATASLGPLVPSRAQLTDAAGLPTAVAPARLTSVSFGEGCIFVDSTQAGVERLWNLAMRGGQSVEESRATMEAR